MAGLIVDNQNEIIGYTIVDVDTNEIGNYPVNKLTAVLKVGHTIENLELKRGKLQIAKGLDASKFPVRCTNEQGKLQLIRNQYAIIIIGRLNNTKIAIITSDAKAYEINYEKLVKLVVTKGVVLVNAKLKIDNQCVTIIPDKNKFILDDDRYPVNGIIHNEKPQQPNKNIINKKDTKENIVPHIKDIKCQMEQWFKIVKNEDGSYTLAGFREDLSNLENFGQILIIPEGIEFIDDHAFDRNNTLKTVYIQKTVKRIGEFSFRGQSISEVIVEDGLKIIGSNAFNGSKLNSINIPKSVTYIGMQQFKGTSIEKLYIQGKLMNIGEQAFAYCDKLQSLVLDTPQCTIKQGAFSLQGLRTVVIMQAKVIESWAFNHCNWLKEFQTRGPVGQIKQSALNHCILVEKLDFCDGLKALQTALLGPISVQTDPFDIEYRLNNPSGKPNIDRTTGVDLNKLERHLFLPDSLEKLLDYKHKKRGATEYRWHFNGYKVHVNKTCNVYTAILELQSNVWSVGNIRIISDQNDQSEDNNAKRFAKKTRIIGKSAIQLYLDMYTEANKQVLDQIETANQIGKTLRYELDKLETNNFYSDYKLNTVDLDRLMIQSAQFLHAEAAMEIENYSYGQYSQASYNSWIGIKLINLLQKTQRDAKDVVNILLNSNIEGIKNTVKSALIKYSFKYENSIINLIEIELSNRLMPNSVYMYIVLEGRNKLLFQRITDFKIEHIPKESTYPLKDTLTERLRAGDIIQIKNEFISKGSSKLFGVCLADNPFEYVLKAANELYSILKHKQIRFIHGKQIYMYMPENGLVIKPDIRQTYNGQPIFNKLKDNTTIIIKDIDLCSQQDISKSSNKSAQVLKSFEAFKDFVYSDTYIPKQIPCKAAEIAQMEHEYLQKLQKVRLCDLQCEQITKLMDQEFMEAVDPNDAIKLIRDFEIPRDKIIHRAGDSWKLTEVWINKQQRFNKITLQKPVMFYQLQVGSKKIQCIYILEIDGKMYYRKSQYRSNEIASFIYKIVQFSDVQNAKTRLKRLTDQYINEYLFGTYTDGTKRLKLHEIEPIALGRYELQCGKGTKIRVHINPFNCCAYLVVACKFEYPITILPLKQVEDGLELIKDARNNRENELLDKLCKLQRKVTAPYTDKIEQTPLTELIIKRDQNRTNYENAFKVDQSIFKHIGTCNSNQIYDIQKYIN